MSRRNFISSLTGAALAAALIPGAAFAQTDVIRIVVPIGAGNPFDTGARALADGLAKVTGKTVIVDNKRERAGASALRKWPVPSPMASRCCTPRRATPPTRACTATCPMTR
jgi:hypothetical protein